MLGGLESNCDPHEQAINFKTYINPSETQSRDYNFDFLYVVLAYLRHDFSTFKESELLLNHSVNLFESYHEFQENFITP